MQDFLEPVALLQEKLSLWLRAVILHLPNLVVAILVLILFFSLAGFTQKIVSQLFKKIHWNGGLEILLTRVIRIAVILMGFIIFLNILSLDKAFFSLLAGVGVLGLALGFAFRDLAANFISGVFIAVNSPFKLGDTVDVGNATGKVVDIHMRDTVLLSSSGQRISVPNQEFLTTKIVNYSQNGSRRVEIKFGIGSGDKIDRAKELLLELITETQGVLTEPAPVVHYDEFGDSSIGMSCLFWVKYPGSDHLAIRDDIFLKIKLAADEKKFSMPNPITTLEFTDSTKKDLISLKSKSIP